MASNQQSDQQSDQNQQSTRQGDSLSGSIQSANAGANPGAEQRSEGLLPADDQDDDGRFEVAEEVSLDQQSDKLRHVGQAADLSAEAAAVENDPDAATGNVLPDPAKQSDG
jgi:hypothetical protein